SQPWPASNAGRASSPPARGPCRRSGVAADCRRPSMAAGRRRAKGGAAVDQRPVIDADGHVRESDRELIEYLPEPYRNHPALPGASFFPTLDGFHRPASKVADGRGRAVLNPSGDDWLAFLDQTNIAASVLFPTGGLGFGLIADPVWATALARGYNDWLHDRYLRLAPRRLKGMALIPLQDPPAAAAELRRAVGELGFVGAILPACGLYEAFGHRSFWP